MSSFPLDGAGNMRQFVLTIKDIREEDYGKLIVTLETHNFSVAIATYQLVLSVH